MKKKSSVYIGVLCVWSVCALALFIACGSIVYNFLSTGITTKKIVTALLLMANALMLAYMWLGSVKDFLFSFLFLIRKKHILKRYDKIIHMPKEEVDRLKIDGKNPKFYLLYCTCNDFNEEALFSCMQQDYDNFETVILDDSGQEEYKQKIDQFAQKTGAKVVRRANRKGFKAGNLNHFLSQTNDYEYCVILDADERIPKNYIQEVLKYFAYSKTVGVVQASHSATKGSNLFQSLMGMSVKSNGKICQVMKNFYGSNALIGHGMTISRACYEQTGGFPEVVAEDISFAIDVKNNGFRVLYAPNIECKEEFPINYLCLKKRQAKWVQGNVEFMKNYHGDITNSKMTWYEKLDVMLSHYNLPIIPMLSFFIIINTVAIGLMNYNISGYSLAIVGLMLLFLISPLIPDFFVHDTKRQPLKLIGYALLNFVVYASLVPMMIATVTLALLGKKAKFIVTPKEEKKITLKEAMLGSYDSILFACIIGMFTYVSYFSLLPTFFLVLSCALAPIAIFLANFPARHKRTKVV